MYVILQNPSRQEPNHPTTPTVGVISVFQNSLQQEIVLPAGHPSAMVELRMGTSCMLPIRPIASFYVVDTVSRQIQQTLAVGPSPSMALASPEQFRGVCDDQQRGHSDLMRSPIR